MKKLIKAILCLMVFSGCSGIKPNGMIFVIESRLETVEKGKTFIAMVHTGVDLNMPQCFEITAYGLPRAKWLPGNLQYWDSDCFSARISAQDSLYMNHIQIEIMPKKATCEDLITIRSEGSIKRYKTTIERIKCKKKK